MNEIKVLAMYLPQFHQIPENDEWWGEGFTEWTAVKKAESFSDCQYQPRIPLNENYYDLLDKKTMQWQADLMKKYGIDGQCIYHYWFKEGRQILEKPAENLLRWKEINMPFFFCWANDSWARTWSKISDKNVWASSFEPKKEENDSGILLEQDYGNETQWKKHFMYLANFFRDERYLKIENKPLFVISRVNLISCLADMIELWRQWAKEEGFDGIYVIGADSNNDTDDILDMVLCHEPSHVVRNFRYKGDAGRKDILGIDYDEAWNELLKYQSMKKRVIYGGFVDYDDTPRRGREGTFFKNVTSGKFKRYLTELLAKNVAQGNTMVFINAWNEWGEGMYLEPDEKNGYGFLEAIPYAKDHYIEYLYKYEIDPNMINASMKKEMEMLSAKAAKHESYWKLLNTWLCLKEENIHLENYFINKGIHCIAVYGIGMLGKHLVKELEKGKIQVKYIIDRKGDTNQTDIKVYAPEEELPDVEAIVVTATYAYNDISKELRERGCQNVISLEEVITKMV